VLPAPLHLSRRPAARTFRESAKYTCTSGGRRGGGRRGGGRRGGGPPASSAAPL